MTLPTLQMPGAVLRRLELSDAEALFAAHGNERTHHYWSGPAHHDVAQTRAYIADTIAMDGAQGLAMGGNFYQLRDWSDDDWNKARESIKAQNEKDRASRN